LQAVAAEVAVSSLLPLAAVGSSHDGRA